MVSACFSLVVLAFAVSFAQGTDLYDDGPVEKYEMGDVDLLFTPEQERALRTRSAMLHVKKWPNATIPYIIDPAFQSIPSRMAALKQAIQDYNENTCIRVVPRSNQADYVRFINGGGCYSYLGVSGGEQPISYGEGCDTTRGTPVHEIMHCLGFMHEQQRPDRDNYVVINNQNIVSGSGGNFQKTPATEADLLGTKYDITSVMHYPKWAFSSNGKDTIVTKDASLMDKIGQRKFFSACDLARINKLYNCGSKFKTTC
jgi:hypothetical protein